MCFYKEGEKVPKEVLIKEKDDVQNRQVNVHQGKGVFEPWMETYNNSLLVKIYKEYICNWALANCIRFGGRENIMSNSRFFAYTIDNYHGKRSKVMVVMQINRYNGVEI